MHEQDIAIVKSLVSVAWADGVFTDAEHEMIDALLNGFQATSEEVKEIRDYYAETKTLDDMPISDLSNDNRRVLLERAVLLTFVDGEPAAAEKVLVDNLAERLRIPPDESKALIQAAEQHAKQFLKLL